MRRWSDRGIRHRLLLVEWNGYYRNVLHFYGHIHNNFDNETNQYISKVKNAYNVGVDIIGFMPKPLKEILEMG